MFFKIFIKCFFFSSSADVVFHRWQCSIFNQEERLQGKFQLFVQQCDQCAVSLCLFLYPVLINLSEIYHSLYPELNQFICDFVWRNDLFFPPCDECCCPLLVLQMMKFAWDNYKTYAWGKNELRPLTKNGHIGNMFGECLYFNGAND